MTIRTIVANTMQQAMQQAKREMGDDAIILRSRRVDDHFEVTVTDNQIAWTRQRYSRQPRAQRQRRQKPHAHQRRRHKRCRRSHA